jgi:HPt (histidine-containing phosphotransfer) domain-containing protein
MEYHLFNIPDTMSTRGNSDLVAHAFLAGIIGFLVTAVIYGYATDLEDRVQQQNKIRNLEEKVESLQAELEEERERAEYNGEATNDLGARIQELEKDKAALIGVLETTLKNYKTD